MAGRRRLDRELETAGDSVAVAKRVTLATIIKNRACIRGPPEASVVFFGYRLFLIAKVCRFTTIYIAAIVGQREINLESQSRERACGAPGPRSAILL